MEIGWLKAFTEIARQGNLTRAAAEMYVSQSALSAQLKALEDELAVKLFDRLPKGMRLTRAGQTLLVQAESVLDAAAQMTRSARLLTDEVSGTIRIALNSDPRFLRMTGTSERIAEMYPHLSVYFIAASSFRAPKYLMSEDYDLAFVSNPAPVPGIGTVRLGEVELRIVAPASYARQIKGASWEDLAKMPWVLPSTDCAYYTALGAWAARQGLPGIDTCCRTVADDEYIVVELVSAGQGLAVMKESDASRLLESGKVVAWEHEPIRVPLGLSWLERREDEPAVRSVRDIIVDMWQEECAPAAP